MTRSLHFTIKINSNHNINNVAIFLGIFARIVGFIIGELATLQYSRKRKEIKDGIFNPSNRCIFFIPSLYSILIFNFIIFMYLSCYLYRLITKWAILKKRVLTKLNFAEIKVIRNKVVKNY
ncbi:hypothetical protein ACWF7H_23410, partial [Peribacillus butanolivorans]